jgi:hypothetical protein
MLYPMALEQQLTTSKILLQLAQHAVTLAEAAVLNARETCRAATVARQTARSLRERRNLTP